MHSSQIIMQKNQLLNMFRKGRINWRSIGGSLRMRVLWTWGSARCTRLAPALEFCNAAFLPRPSYAMPTVLCTLSQWSRFTPANSSNSAGRLPIFYLYFWVHGYVHKSLEKLRYLETKEMHYAAQAHRNFHHELPGQPKSTEVASKSKLFERRECVGLTQLSSDRDCALSAHTAFRIV